MPMHPVTSTLMYRGICTIPDILSYSAPVNLPEDEVEGEMIAYTCFHRVCVCVRANELFAPTAVLLARGQNLGQRSELSALPRGQRLPDV